MCPAALEHTTLWRHAVSPACAPPQLDEARLGCAGACPTPCRELRTTNEHVEPSVTHFAYDAEGRWLSSKYDHNHGSDACTYDGARLKSCNDVAMTFDYNADGLLEVVHVPEHEISTDLPTMRASYKSGRLVRVENAGVAAELGYDAGGRLVRELLEAPAGLFSLTYDYDARGRLVRRRSSTKSDTRVDLSATYEYDPATGLLTKRVEPWNSGTATATYRYDPRGRVTHAELHFVLPAGDDGPQIHSWTKLDYEYDEACAHEPRLY